MARQQQPRREVQPGTDAADLVSEPDLRPEPPVDVTRAGGAAGGSEAELRAENERLRAENDRLRAAAGPASPPLAGPLRQQVEALTEQNREMRRRLADSAGLVPIAALGEPPPPVPPAVPLTTAVVPIDGSRVRGNTVPIGTPADGPVLWRARLAADRTAPVLTFFGPTDRLAASQRHLRLAGMREPGNPIKLEEVDPNEFDRPAAEPEPDPEPAAVG